VDIANFLMQRKGKTSEESRIVFTGLRPGEKLHEEFIGPGELLANFVRPRLRAIERADMAHDFVHSAMAELDTAARARNLEAVLQAIARLVPEYHPSASLDAARSAAWAAHHA
jgi:FlaA1/EpsC-like NDP-sugar epimerase